MTSRRQHPRWGQNFLVDAAVARGIVEWADIAGRDVVEIGPGHGALTALLAERARSLLLIEIDPVLAVRLRGLYASNASVRVVESDVLEVDLRGLASDPFSVVANLPYESGTAIVRRLLELQASLTQAVVMLQKEVCQRMTAAAGSKRYGVLSVHIAMHADVTPGRIVGPSSFRPRPKVESQLLRIRPLPGPRWPHGDPGHFRDVVRVAFSERRKMLRNTLGRWLAQRLAATDVDAVFADAAVSANQRPETVDPEQFARIAAQSHEMLSRYA